MIYAEFGLEDAIPQIAWIYGTLGEAYSMHRIDVDIEFSTGIENIVEACAMNRLRTAAYNFIANKSVTISSFLESKFEDAAYTFAYAIDGIIETCIDYALKGVCHEVAHEICDVAEAYAKFGTPRKYAVDRLNENLNEFERCCREKGILSYRGWFDQDSIRDILNDAKKILSKLPTKK